MKITKQIVLIVLVGISLIGCSTARHELYDNDKKAEAEFIEKNGSLTISFDKDGNWETIKSSATYNIVGNGHTSISDASTIASMRAKQNITEFISNDVRTEKTFNGLTKAYSEQLNDGDDKINKEGADVATKLQTQITDSSAAILKGVILVSQQVSGNKVAVTVQVDRKSLKAARDLRHAFAF
ncbi:MAG: hypothetical protein V4536_02740 [Pseudomonadota bacterium]|jgi:hypothetical protein